MSTPLEIVGYIAALLMGTTLGLIGGGGSILTVPILVYLFGISAVQATAYSLLLVGATALVGSANYIRRGDVDFRAAFFFGLPSFGGVFLTRRYLLPALPEVIFSRGGWSLTKDDLVLLVFALFMLAASISMIRRAHGPEQTPTRPRSLWWTLVDGLIVGTLTGFVGAGGGFLIIPALVLLAGLPIKIAIGTSLLIIAIKSLFGFTGDLLASTEIDWWFAAVFSLSSITGIVIGTHLSEKVSPARLKLAFGWFVLVMGSAILIKEILW